MCLSTLLLTAVTHLSAFEIDCGALPAANVVPAPYKIRLTLGFASGLRDTFELSMGRSATPEDACDSFEAAFTDEKWVIERRGVRLLLVSYDGARLTHLTVTSTGPKLAIRWVPRVTPRKPAPKP